MTDARPPEGHATIVRLPQSVDAFERLFALGMDLVEETSLYLDGEGREEAKGLPPGIAAQYGSQAMALTTRLMRLASWLLIQRSLIEGEIEPDQAEHEMAVLKIDQLPAPRNNAAYGALPEMLRALIERSCDVQVRVLRFAEAGQPVNTTEHADNGVNTQLALLRTVFSR